MSIRRVAVTVGVLVEVALLPPAASGDVRGVVRIDRPDPRDLTGLSLAGDGLVWGQLSPYRLGAPRTWTVRLVRDGQSPRTLFTAVIPWGAERPTLAASPTQLAVMPAVLLAGRLIGWRLLAGPLDGPLALLNDSVVVGPPKLEWSGTLLAAKENPGGITVRDAAGGFAPHELRQAFNPADDVRIAGPHVAIATTVTKPGDREEQVDRRVDIVRLDDGVTEYSILAEDAPAFDYDLQEDGKVAWLDGDVLNRPADRWEAGTLYWASPAEPWPHPITTNVATHGIRIRLAGDRVVFSRPAGGWERDPLVAPWIADLAGASRPIWFRVPAGWSDFDGVRLAVATNRCVWLGDVQTQLAGPPAGTCPRQVTSEGTRRITRDGTRSSFGIHCVTAPMSGCRGVARLEAGRRVRGPRRLLAVRRFHARLGGATRARFRVSRGQLRRLRNTKGSVVLSLQIRSTDTTGLTSVTEGFPLGVRP
jgi:hypothetical protein